MGQPLPRRAVKLATGEPRKHRQGVREIEPDELTPDREPESGIDLAQIRDNLRMSPWERILANDDTANFAESLRAAVNRKYAETARTAGQAG
jgi:hypothetical protein